MALDKTLDAVNEKLAKAFGLVKDIEKSIKNIERTSGKVNLGGGKAGTVSANAKGGGNLLANSLGQFSTPTPGKGGGTVSAGGGGTGGGGGLSGRAAAYSGGSGAMAAQMMANARREERVGQIMSGSLAVFTGTTAAAWSATPGVADATAYKASVFMPKFTLPDGFANKNVEQRIINSVGGMASSTFGAQAAASLATANGFTFNMGGGKVLDNMLATSGLMYGMTGMSNEASMRGQVAMYKGTGGVSDRLSRIGIFTVNMQTGKPKDMGEIVDSLWARLYGSKTAEVTEEKFEGSLAMGWLGAELNALFGDQPELYEQVVTLMRLKVKNKGKQFKAGSKEARDLAKRSGMNEYNTPTVGTGAVNTARSKTVDATSDDLMNAFVNSSYVIEDFNTAVVKVTDALGPLAGVFLNFKGMIEGLGPTEVGQTVMGVLGAIKGLMPGFAPGGTPGAISGPGTSTSDSIPVKLSRGEYVINAAAAKIIGSENLNALNSMGRDLGSAYASPVALLAGGSLERSGSEAVSWALSSTAGGAKFPSLCDRFVANAYGLARSNYDTAALHWSGIPPEYRHEGDKNPPPGALVFWSATQSNSAGHAAIVTGYENGKALIVTTHTNGGTPVQMPLEEVMQGSYLGWATPYFHGKTADVGANNLSSETDKTGSISGGTTTEGSSSQGSIFATSGTSGLFAVASAGTNLGVMSDGKRYSAMLGSSLAGFGKTGKPIGEFTSGYVNASLAGNNEKTITVLTGGLTVGNDGGEEDDSSSSSSSGTTTPASTGATPSGGEKGSTAAPPGKLTEWLKQVGFKGENLREAWAIAMRESHGNPKAVRAGADWGLFQFNKATFKKEPWWDEKKLLDPIYNAKIAYEKSKGGKTWYLWGLDGKGNVKAHVYKNAGWSDQRIQEDIVEPYQKYYKQYATEAQSASVGVERTKAGVYNLHQNETVFPAMESEMFRKQLQEFLAEGGKRQGPVTINLNIERASDEEAERFAKKVIKILENKDRMTRLGKR